MRDRGVIYCGLAVFLGLATFPAWHNIPAHVTGKGPDVRLPAHEKQCVALIEFMRTSHMNLLDDWREGVVRGGVSGFTAADGKLYKVSLTPTCLEQCHGSKADFCDKCHNYAAVSPPCWNCHLDFKPTISTRADASGERLLTRAALIGAATVRERTPASTKAASPNGALRSAQ